ncbi:MAG TPA: flippase-like domain-containing protein [Methanocella sp.]|nr:flippase-like domain-containing protein [Methanocella sp.]
MITEADVRFPDIPFRKTAVLIVVGLVLYFGYLYLVGFDTVRDLLARVDLPLVALALLVSLCGNVFHTAGWWVLLRHMGYKISLGLAYLIYLSSIFFTNLVPSAALSGEIGKLYFIQKTVPGTRVDRTFAAGLFSRLLEVVPTGTGAILGVAYLTLYYSLPLWALVLCAAIAVGIAVAALFVLAVAMNAKLLRSAANALLRVASVVLKGRNMEDVRGRVEALVAQFDASIREISASKTLVIKSLALIFVAWAFDVSVAYIAFASIGYRIPIGVVVTIYSMMVLVTLIPAFVPGGLGYVDGLMNLLYSLAGVGRNDAFSGTFVIRLVTLWFLTAVGGLCTLFLARATGTGRSRPGGPQ